MKCTNLIFLCLIEKFLIIYIQVYSVAIILCCLYDYLEITKIIQITYVPTLHLKIGENIVIVVPIHKII